MVSSTSLALRRLPLLQHYRVAASAAVSSSFRPPLPSSNNDNKHRLTSKYSRSLSSIACSTSSSSLPCPTFGACAPQHRHFSSTALADNGTVENSNSSQQQHSDHPPNGETAKPPRARMSDVLIADVLKAKHSYRWVDPVIHKNATVREAIGTVIEGGLSGMMVVETDPKDKTRKVVGLVTSRDVLRILAAGLKEGMGAEELFDQVVSKHMTPISQVVYGRPNETIGMCRALMAKLGIKCLPILSDQKRVEGLITARDMSDFGLSAKDKGGKKTYLNDVSERVGLGSNTSMAEPPTYLQSQLAMARKPLFVNVGCAELPHPFKRHDGVGANLRDHGPRAPAEDSELSEDAYFSTTLKVLDEKGGNPRDVTYFGVADGVGSWREYNVDPREFSHKLMEECERIVKERTQDNMHHQSDTGSSKYSRSIAPSDILAAAYDRVKAANIIGSCTACVAMFDNVRHQLHFSNLGDSGIIVLRHADSDIAGSLNQDRVSGESEPSSDLRVAFVSQQQLHSFNHPYQLGWLGYETEERNSFKSVQDANVTSVHVRRGDIIIMGTDGLFDNVEIDDIAKICLEWELKWGFVRGGDIAAREQRWANGNSLTILSSEHVSDLAAELCRVAREKSLDKETDSPFAILAKDSDIMWSGGMPDDCTVIIAHVVGRAADDVMDVDQL